MTPDIRLQFDIACALAVLGQGEELAMDLPKKLEPQSMPSELIQRFIEPSSFERSSCIIKKDLVSSPQSSLHVGNDEYTLFPGGRIIAGGSGVTIQVYDKGLQRPYALKVPRVSVLAYQPKEFVNLDSSENLFKRIQAEYSAFENERQISRRLSHPNIAQHFYGSSKEIPSLFSSAMRPQLPFSISEWIEGARPLHTYLLEEKPNVRATLDLIMSSISALSHVHKQKVIHWDLKSDNILVSSDGIVKLIDFGNAKFLDVIRADDSLATTTSGKFPEISTLVPQNTGFDESRRFSVKLAHRSWNHPFIDLWMLCQEWNRCILISEEYLSGFSDLTETEQRSVSKQFHSETTPRSAEICDCLGIIFDRVLAPFSIKHPTELITSEGAFRTENLYYSGADDVIEEVTRVQPRFGAAQDVPELLVSLDEIVRLPVTGNSVFTDRVASVVDTRIVQATLRHFQLAQVRQVFPGATHSRFEHLLGTLTTAAYFVRSLFLNETNAFWRVSVGAEDIRAVLLASILHDSGHLAFGHSLEEMEDLLFGLKHSDYILFVLKRALNHVLSTAAYEGTPDAASEEAFELPTFRVSHEEVEELVTVLRDHWCDENSNRPGTGAEVQSLLSTLAQIFERPSGPPPSSKAYLTRRGTRDAIIGLLRSIIDGPMDADKLDYLRRDSLHSGVFFAAGIDLERFFESLRACVATRGATVSIYPSIGVSEKGVAPLETIITARYHLYSVVYWHRTVRCITAMLQRLISEVRLSLVDNKAWTEFITEFADSFRRLDDHTALDWLCKWLVSRGIAQTLLSPAKPERQEVSCPKSLGDLLDGVAGNRRKYFRLAYELSYAGSISPHSGKDAREQLHDRICGRMHPEMRLTNDHGLVRRQQLAGFRFELEQRFIASIASLGHREFVMDTILLDVPEPGKDQLQGLQVDRRSKRSNLRSVSPQKDGGDTTFFVELSSVSPIAAALADVFKRWARKVRVFMTQDDLARLHDLGLEAGDVAAIWEGVLYDYFKISRTQPELRI